MVMEFIALKKHKKLGKTKTVEKEKSKKLLKGGEMEKKPQKKEKKKFQTKITEKKLVNNKRKDIVANHKYLKQAVKKQIKEEEEEEENIEEKEEDQEEISEGSDEEQEQSEEIEDTDEDEEAFKKKCKEIDDKKKNRLFIKLKKKILNEMQIKELHPDIRSVIFPRKKKSRWCWAVFASEEKAKKALKDLSKNKGVLVNKPTPYERVDKKKKEKMKTILRKKQATKKLQEMWT